jgi:flavin-dependent dehydrogenase
MSDALEKGSFTESVVEERSPLVLDNGSQVCVIGGGPAGSLFSYFLLQMARRADIDIRVEIYEKRDFCLFGPAGCNMCGGVISESLVQALSIEGINLPNDVVQRGIDSFAFHTTEETVTLHAPFREMRIATVYRGAGPKGTRQSEWRSFDDYLLQLAVKSGAKVVRERVTSVSWMRDKPQINTKDGQSRVYDLVVGAVGVKTANPGIFDNLKMGYQQPRTRRTSVIEYELGADFIDTKLGNSMHAFLLDLPKLDFAAIIPKGNYVTMCLIGDNITPDFVDSFVHNPVVREYIPVKQDNIDGACHCSPRASLCNTIHPFTDRILFIGDCGITRFNKDGIGSAYRVAKTAAATSLFSGVSASDFRRGYWPIYQSINRDNIFGRILYSVVNMIKKSRLLTRSVMRVAVNEQQGAEREHRMSRVLWDMFTGSAQYREVFLRCLHPAIWGRLLLYIFVEPVTTGAAKNSQEELMTKKELGREFRAGETIVVQGEIGECMYVILSGQAEVIKTQDGQETRLAILSKGDIFGEMAIFQRESRSATVRAITDLRVLTVDKKIFLRRVHEDPSFVFAILKKMSQRIRNLNEELTRAGARKEEFSGPKSVAGEMK